MCINGELQLRTPKVKSLSVIPAYAKLTKVVEDTLKCSGYPEIDLNKIFADLMVKRGLA